MGLQDQLALSRLPHRNIPVGRGGRKINAAQELVKQGMFQAFQDNKKVLEDVKESKRKEDLRNKILNGVENIYVEDMITLREILIIALGKTLHHFQENGFNHLDLYGRYEAKMIYIFVANMLRIDELEIQAYTYGEGSRLNSQYETDTISHILNNRPKLLPILERMGITESSLKDKLPKKEKEINTDDVIQVKKGSTIQETLENICSDQEIDLKTLFSEINVSNGRMYLNNEQKSTLTRLGSILPIVHSEHGMKGKIAELLAEKTGFNLGTIKSSYLGQRITNFEIEVI